MARGVWMRGSAGCGLGQRSDRVDGNHDVDSRREDLDRWRDFLGRVNWLVRRFLVWCLADSEVQLDMFAGVGLNNDAGEFFVGIGYSIRWGL